MKNYKLLCLILLSTMMIGYNGCSVTGIADTILVEGQFYTVDEEKSWAEAVAIEDGTIVYVGSTEGVDSYIGEETEVIDLEGKFAMPSFVEGHLHPLTTAYDCLFRATLYGLYTHEEYIEVLGYAVELSYKP